MLDPFLRLPGFDITPGGKKRSHKLPAGVAPKITVSPNARDRGELQSKNMRFAFCFLHGQTCIISPQSPAALLRNPTTQENIFGQAQARTDVMLSCTADAACALRACVGVPVKISSDVLFCEFFQGHLRVYTTIL